MSDHMGKDAPTYANADNTYGGVGLREVETVGEDLKMFLSFSLREDMKFNTPPTPHTPSERNPFPAFALC